MSLQNRQKYETVIDYEGISEQNDESKSGRRQTKALSQYVVIAIVVITVIFFCIFIMNRETAEQIKRKKMIELAEQYKAFNKGPQIHSKQFPPKNKQRQQTNNDQDNIQTDKKDNHFLGKDREIEVDKQEDEEKYENTQEDNFRERDKEDQKSQTHKDSTHRDDIVKEDDLSKSKKDQKMKEEEINHQQDDRKHEDIGKDNKQQEQKEQNSKKDTDDKGVKDEKSKKESEAKNNSEKLQGGGLNYIPMEEEEKPKRQRQQFIDTREENKVFVCPEESFLYSILCQEDCPNDFLGDEYDRVCKSVDMNPMQVEVKIYPDLDDEENKGHIKYVSEYYQILKSEDYINNNKEATYGFFFFNQIENGGFNFLNTNFGGKKLNRFLNNIDGIIVIMSGEENYFLGNDKIIKGIINQTIKDNPQIKKWYSIGLYDVGSYGSLLYLSQMKDKLDGAIVIDPNYMQMIDYYSTLIDLNKYNNTNIFDYINKDRELFKQKDILIIEAENSKQQQHTDNLASSTNSHIIRYNSSKYKNNDDKIESLLFSNIEQFISQMNKNLLKK